MRVLIVGPDATLRRTIGEILRQPAPGGKGKIAARSLRTSPPLLSGLRITEAPGPAEAVSRLQAASRPKEHFSVAVLAVAPASRRPALKLARQLAATAPELPLILCIPPEDGAWWEHVAQRLPPGRVSVVTQPPDPLTLRGLIRAHLSGGVPVAALPATSHGPKHAPASPPALAPAMLRHVVEGLLQGLGQWYAGLERPAADREAAAEVPAAWSRCQRWGSVHRAAALVSQLTLLESPAAEPPGVACDLLQVTGQVVGQLQQLLQGVTEVEGHWEPAPLSVAAKAPALHRVLSDLALLALPAFPLGARLRFQITTRAASPGHRTEAAAGEARVWIECQPAREAPSSPALAGRPSPFLTGLEWTTAQTLITRWKGRLKRSRQPNGRTLMEIHLPIVAASDVPASSPRSPSPACQISAPSATPAEVPAGAVVLLVDDDESVRATTRLFLEEYDCRILEATDSTSALRLWQEQGRNIYLLVVDLVIPGEMDGLQLARRLQAEQPDLRILLTTGYAGAGLIEELKAMPDTEFLSKPYTYAQMHAVLRRYLRPRFVPA